MKHIHERLGLTFQQYAALLAVRQLLVSGDIKLTNSDEPCDNGHYLNMSQPLVKGNKPNTACGSVGCIGGYMAFVMGIPLGDIMEFVNARSRTDGIERPIRKLFFPPDEGEFSWSDLTPAMAVEAIDNFINTGDPRWRSVAENNGILSERESKSEEYKG